MNRLSGIIFVLATVMVCLTSKTLAQQTLYASEVSALTDFYLANSAALSKLSPPWTANPSLQCSTSSTPYQGLTCTSGHVTALGLSSIALGGSIPSSISGLVNATAITMSNCGLTGSLPSEFADMPALRYLDLRNNKLAICQTTPFGLADNCLLSGQVNNICANNSCCGCKAVWDAAFGCSTDTPACATCSGSAPIEYPNATCSNGFYTIPKSYTGGLTITGKVAVLGDLVLPVDQPLIFVGFSATLNVTGRFTMKANGIIVAPTDTDTSMLQTLGSFTYYRYAYMYVSNPATNLGSFSGSNSLVAMHPRRACKKQYTSSVGNSYNWVVSVRYANGCNTWWIILVCVLPAVLAGALGGFLPFCLSR